MKIRKLLYIEDEDDIRLVVSLLLRSQGIEVRDYASGADGIRGASGFQADLVLLDVTMPGINGWETLRQLRRIPGYEATPTVFLTARVDSVDGEDIADFPRTSTLTKPFVPEELVAKLESLYDRITGIPCNKAD